MLWLQAGLFCTAGICYVRSAPTSFWILVPQGALVLGWLAWRSRWIATSMIPHGIGSAVGNMVAWYRL